MEQQFKDYAFGRIAMRRHWDAGLQDMVDTLARPAFFALPDRKRGVATHDVHRIFARADARAEYARRPARLVPAQVHTGHAGGRVRVLQDEEIAGDGSMH